MPSNHEVEIKFRIDALPSLSSRLQAAGFHVVTERTHELNQLYDLPGSILRARGALLRIRQYGPKWTVTYKDKSKADNGRHKSRREIESRVENGQAIAEILVALGFTPTFTYEKFRTEWSDGIGHVVIDETPIGNFGEIEGPPEWIDATAHKLGINHDQYIKESYAELFTSWKTRTGNAASDMTFQAVGSPAR